MRIVFVINNLIYGGAETQLIALSRELASRGHRVAIYTLHADNPRASALTGSGVDLVADRKRWKFDVGLIVRLRGFLRQFQADVVHGFLLDGNFYATLAAAGTGIPALTSERNDNYKWPLPHRLGLVVTRRFVAGLIANSHAGARFAQRLFKLPDARVHVVWNGISQDATNRNPLPPPVDPRTAFFGTPDVKVACLVGMLRPQKDHALALRVAEALVRKDPTWRVLFVGDCLPQTSTYKDEVLQLWKELDLSSVVKFTGVRRDVNDIIRGSDVLFSTSVHEGFPNVVLEAMAVGTPVVSTEYSDIRLILPCAWQVAGREPNALADAILRADRERIAVADAQREWLMSNATIAMAASRLEKVYAQYALRAAQGAERTSRSNS